jgi:TetR/AcrR family transcriptional repressor of nem operon
MFFMEKHSSTKDEIIKSAQELIQTRGYNGFSYADISAIVGIRKASIHHYFPSKVDLAVEVARRYQETFNKYLLNISIEKKSWVDKVRAYIKLYEKVLQDDKLCLCGMLASDSAILPSELKEVLQDFFSSNVAWLMKVLLSHPATLSQKRLRQISWQIINSLQGGIMVARIFSKPKLFSSACEELIISLEQAV